jgi:hypothetical protein
MAQGPPVIRVPKPARSSYQPNRPFAKNTLLQNHVKHFRELEKQLPPEQQTGIPVDAIETEGQAADYIRRMTGKLHRPPAKP